MSSVAVERVYNFSPGPGMLPRAVLEEVQRDLLGLPGLGISPLEISHRSPWFLSILAEAESNLRKLLDIPANYRVLFLQGGARLQFSMIPMNLLRGSARAADYIITGTWSKGALEEAVKEGPVRTVFTNEAEKFRRLPRRDELQLDPDAAYLYCCSNETIQGVQHHADPDYGAAPLVCDMASDFLHRPVDVSRYAMIYACAQKNAGPAGVTVVIIRDDMLERAPAGLGAMLDYRSYVKEGGMPNTPPVFSIYVLTLVSRWLLDDVGGLANMHAHNRRKAALLYDAIDASGGYFTGHAAPECRSLMNVTFRLPDEASEKRFLDAAKAEGLVELRGHRSVGGMRASIYNAMPIEGVELLAGVMKDQARKG